MTPAQRKRADAAFSAANTWATTCPPESLRDATEDRLVRSYGIVATDASRILTNARRERGL